MFKSRLAILIILAGCTPMHPSDEEVIRYDKNSSAPIGYIKYCKEFPEKPECGGKK